MPPTLKAAQSEQEIQSIFKQAPVAINIYEGKNFIVKSANDLQLKLWGKTEAEVINKPLFEAIPEIRGQGFEEMLTSILETGKSISLYERKAQTIRDGKPATVYTDAHFQPWYNEFSEVKGIIVIATDVTDKVEARKAIEVGREQLRLITDAMPALIAYVDKEQRYRFNNRRYEEWFGHSIEEVNGKTLKEVMGEDAYEVVLPYTKKALSGEAVSYEARVPYKDGGERYIQANLVPHITGEKEVLGYYALVTDITESKRIEETLIYRKALLEAQNEAVPDAILIVDTKGKMLSFNKNFSKLWRIPQEIIDRKDDTAALEFAMTQVADPQGFIDRVTYCYQHPDIKAADEVLFKDGRIIERCGNAVVGEDGISYGWVWHFRDITKQKEAELTLAKSEEQFRHFSNNIINLAWIADSEGWIYWYNQRWYDYTGTTLEEMQGWGWEKVHHPDHIERVITFVKEAWKTPEPWELTFPLRSASGEYRWFLTYCVPILDDKGNITKWIGTNTDIQEQKLVEEAIKESEGRFQNLIREATVGIILLTGPEMKVEIVNNAYGNLIDRSVDELLGKELFTIIPDAEEHYRPVLEKVMQSGEPLYLFDSFYSIKKDGKQIEGFLNLVYQPYRNQEDKIIGVMALCQDVTESVRAKRALEESENRFRTMAETLPQMIWMRRNDGMMEYASENWEKYSGYKDISEAWRAMTHPDDWSNVMGAWEIALKTNEPFRYEVRLKNKHGEYRWHNASGVPVRDEQDNVVKWLGALTDIQEQKNFSEKLEREVAERTRELARSNEDLQQFAHVASHDLKEPVRKVLTFVNRITNEFDGELPDKLRSYLSKIENAARRSYSMIDGVLQYSSFSNLEQAREPVNLKTLLQNIELDLEVLIQQKDAQLIYESRSLVQGSALLMHQLFYNLVNNSLKFSRTDVKPVVHFNEVECSKDELKAQGLDSDIDFVKIILKDNGIGFKDDEAEKIFGSFTRLHSKDRYEGTGLGLALCKKIVERHGGSIYAEGKEGEGATFTILLPKY